MSKTHKTININSEVYNDIKKRSNSFGFNFSDWVEKEYCNKFMNVEQKEEEISKLNQKINNLNKEIVDIKDRQETFKDSFSRNEKRLLIQIPRLIKEGKEWKALKNRFNLTFSREFTLEEFKKHVRYFEDEQKRVNK